MDDRKPLLVFWRIKAKRLPQPVIVILCLVVVLFMSSQRAAASTSGLVINEILVSNVSQTMDEKFYNFSDWIEIYNGSNASINLNGYYLSDDFEVPDKWRIGSGNTIGAQDYLLFWADGKDTGRHTNFKLNHDGEAVYLFDDDENLVDSIIFVGQISDVSYGRLTDGSNLFAYFDSPTPGQPNGNSQGVLTQIQAPTPEFSMQGGFFAGSQLIELSLPVNSQAAVYFTLDGSLPTTAASLYTGPITLNETTVVRARAFGTAVLPSEVNSQTFLIDEETSLPVISISTNSEYFFDDTIGIYVEGTNGKTGHCASGARNWNQEWERPVNVQFFEDDRVQSFNMDGGVEIGGNCSRRFNIKPLKISFRDKYGDNDLDYRVFKDSPIDEWGYFFLRNSGNDWRYSYFREGFMQELIKGYMDVDSRNYRPAVVFLNGEYFGIHNIRERINKEYLAAHHDVDPENVDLLKTKYGVIEGSTSNYSSLLYYLRNNSLSDPDHYEEVKEWVDVDEFIDYEIAQIYYANTDWPGNNIKYWRPRTEDGRWRWLLYDTDYGFGSGLWDQEISTPSHNTLEMATASNGANWPNPPWSTEVLRKMLRSDEFEEEFIQRFAAHLSITFNPERTVDMIDQFENRLADEMPRHIEHVGQPKSFSRWQDEVDVMRDFANLRPGYLFNHLEAKFGLGNPSELTLVVDPAGYGNILVQGVPINAASLTAELYRGIPIRVEAVPNPGYRLVRWEGKSSSTNPKTSFEIYSDSEITAVFEPLPALVINEIHYNSDGPRWPDSDFEFIELYNADTEAINLAGYAFTAGITYTFTNQILQPGEYLLVAKNQTTYVDEGCQVVQWFDGTLSNSGEKIEIQNEEELIIDAVIYDDGNNGGVPDSPWVSAPDGELASLELIDPAMDNALAESWMASETINGTPCRSNHIDAPTPSVNINHLSVLEGDSGIVTADIEITLSNLSLKPISVSYSTAAGSAQPGSDFTAAAGTINFAPTEDSQTISVEIVSDTEAELDELFLIQLSDFVNAVEGPQTTAEIIIVDDDLEAASQIYLPLVITRP